MRARSEENALRHGRDCECDNCEVERKTAYERLVDGEPALAESAANAARHVAELRAAVGLEVAS